MRKNAFRSVPYGTLVRQSELGVRALADSKHGVALANVDSEGFAASTVDGGRTWRIDSPVFFAPAADAPLAVSLVGAANAHSYYAWGGGGSVVDTTTDGGQHWWQAFLSETVLAVTTNQSGQLVAVVQRQRSNTQKLTAMTAVYASRNGGRTWALTDQMAAG
jgi:photosystem II stability/assembly factor-like uncharacterized protein